MPERDVTFTGCYSGTQHPVRQSLHSLVPMEFSCQDDIGNTSQYNTAQQYDDGNWCHRMTVLMTGAFCCSYGLSLYAWLQLAA